MKSVLARRRSAYAVRYSFPRLFHLVVRRATVISELSASLTAFSEGKALATSGVSKTRFVPRRYSFRYFLRTPAPNEAREYSVRSSSPLHFGMNRLFASGHRTLLNSLLIIELRWAKYQVKQCPSFNLHGTEQLVIINDPARPSRKAPDVLKTGLGKTSGNPSRGRIQTRRLCT